VSPVIKNLEEYCAWMNKVGIWNNPTYVPRDIDRPHSYPLILVEGWDNHYGRLCIKATFDQEEFWDFAAALADTPEKQMALDVLRGDNEAIEILLDKLKENEK
jgi:hypothetical protein